MDMIITRCPEEGCDAPAEVIDQLAMESTGGPVTMVRVVGVCGHRFAMPLTWLALPAERVHPAGGAWAGRRVRR
jgi:hypothetical protein